MTLLPTRYVLGGLHLTHSSFLPTALLKELSATEAQGWLDPAALANATLEQLDRWRPGGVLGAGSRTTTTR